MKLSKKQREFLEAVEGMKAFSGLPLICIHNMPESIWFTFRTERRAYQWVANLESHGLVKIEQEHFARLTRKGLDAIAKPA